MRAAAVCLMAIACVSGVSSLRADAQSQESSSLQPFDAGPITYYIGDGAPGSDNGVFDRELAAWALRDWERTLDGAVTLEAAGEEEALLRVYWVSSASAGRYGEMRALNVNGRRGAEVFIRAETDGLGSAVGMRARSDALFRDTIVYLTCLHELGHAFGLSHTSRFADVMYSFQYRGDIPGFFSRYRERLHSRTDIPTVSGLSDDDVRRVRDLYRR